MKTLHPVLYSTLLLFLTSLTTARACDFCNCLAAINPWYNGTNSVALHAMIQRAVHGGGASGSFIKSTMLSSLAGIEHGGHDGDEGDSIPSTETRTTFELSGRWQVAADLMVTAALPVVLLNSGETAGQGLGDPRVMAYYVVRDSAETSALLLGGGLALPLGTVDLRDDDGTLLRSNEQPGTRAFTAMLNATAQTRLGGWTLTGDLLGRLPFGDSKGNRRGASAAASGSVGHDLLRSNEQEMGLIGIAGVRCEAAGRDRVSSEDDPASGFTALYGQLGAQAVLGSIRIDATVLIPLASHRPEASPQEEPRVVGGVRYQF